MKYIRLPAVAAAATAVLCATAAGVWYAGSSGGDEIASVCVPAYERDVDKAGYAAVVAVVTVTRTAGYLEEEPELPGGVLMSTLRVDEPLKGTPPAELTVGQGVGRTSEGGYTTDKPESYPVLSPGHRYVVGTTPSASYRDGWVWFAVPADTGLDAQRVRWVKAVADQVSPHPDPRCTGDVVTRR
ncbi:hypothetical protein [Streptomyces acidiscabies]|uniref:hypothetical protein n=1 Tax=Streptomyces acidiscabies TaxID=42234 RepID=UPI00073EE4F7|nr:hypothetical protein [Streptomyces acidiscabies]GAQ51440.1 hypothetical protein a10_01220 [Streptomyces acidiscabies]